MSDHVAALYTVRIHRRRKPDDLQLLGGFGDDGTGQLLYLVDGYLQQLETESDDEKRTLKVASCAIDANTSEVRLRLELGQRGQRFDHYDGDQLEFSQRPVHTAKVLAGALFRLPPDANIGFLVIYVPYRRGSITLLRDVLTARFREDFPALVLQVKPAVEGTALKRAVDENQIEKIQLLRYDRHTDAFEGGSAKWTRAGEAAEIALEVRGRRGARILPNLIKQYLEGETGVFGEIVEFEGLRFEHAKVQVREGETVRTYNIENPEAGHAITRDIGGDLKFDEEGWPADEALVPALRDTLPKA
jgi:hypothetical protein